MPDLKPEYSDRGFAHLEPVLTRQEAEVKTYESSSAEGPHLWLSINQPSNIFISEGSRTSAHLNLDQAREVHEKLGKMIELTEASWSVEPGAKYDYEEEWE